MSWHAITYATWVIGWILGFAIGFKFGVKTERNRRRSATHERIMKAIHR